MEAFLQPIKISMIVSLIALGLVFIIGITAAWLTERKFKKRKAWLDTILLSPIVLPPTVIGFILIMLFGKEGILGEITQFLFNQSIMFTVWAAIIAAVIVAFPLMYQSIKTGLSLVDHHIEEAARVDGASEWEVFRYVTFPLIKKSVFAGAILSFARALGEFGATLMFAGNIPGRTQTVPMAIYVAFESNKMTLAWAWVISILFVSFIMLYILQKKE